MELLDISKLTKEQKHVLMTELSKDMMVNLSQELNNYKALTDKRMNDLETQINDVTDNIEQDLNNLINKTIKIHTDSADDKYYTRRNLGKMCNPVIKNKMTNLLRWAGIIQKNQNIPYDKYLNGKEPLAITYKITNANGYENIDYKYHFKKSWEIINEKLNNYGIYNQFYACKSRTEINSYIDKITNKEYIENN